MLDYINRVYAIEWQRVSDASTALWIYSKDQSTNNMYTPRLSPIIQEGLVDEIDTVYDPQDDHLYVGYHSDQGFDMIGAIFYLLSRYEEYGHYIPDEHGRFPYTASDAFRKGYIERPLVDLWLTQWVKSWNEAYPSSPISKRTSYEWIPTIDIDLAYAYVHKGWKTYAGIAKDIAKLDFTNLAKRISAICNHDLDPYNSYSWLSQIHKSAQTSAVYFFQLGDYGGYDESLGHNHPALIQLIQKTAQSSSIGIHPSYVSHDALSVLLHEKNQLSQIIDHDVYRSRQHYLRLSIPNTYGALLEVGITEDYTMGYAEHIGFRAGTSHSFLWYDIEQERISSLCVFPFSIMDVSLQKYMNLSIDEAKERIDHIKHTLHTVNGVLCTIWHNSSFGFPQWQGWDQVYQHLAS